MPIVSSAVADFSIQIDKRVWVREQQLDQFGLDHGVTYLAAANTTSAQALTTATGRAPSITAQMTANEIANNLVQFTTMGAAAQMSINESTIAQNLTAFAAILPTLSASGIVSSIAFLNSLGGPTLQSLFGFTSAQVTSMQSTAVSLPAAVASAMALLEATIKGGGG